VAGDDATIPQTPNAAAGSKRTTQLPNRYRVGEVIGEGGMGRVYRAHDTMLGRDVAIKVIETELPGPDKTVQRERFVREARAAARLIHPNIAMVHDVDPDAGWLVMELVEGESLREVAMRGPLAPSLVRTIAVQVLSGLACAHDHGVIHRDVKPSNIILADKEVVKLVDFGVARLLDVEVTRTGEHLGTPAYMAPEQMRGGTADGRTDLYGLGATLYELITGTRMIAFESPSESAMAKVADATAGDGKLAALIVKCLQADPDRRPASATEAIAMVSRRAATEAARRAGPHRRWLAIAGIAVLVCALLAAIVWRLRRETPRDLRLSAAFSLAQRGENEKASEQLQAYLVDHPGDGDALVMKFLTDWWQYGSITDTQRVLDAKITPAQRALVRGVDLIAQRRETEAIGYLEGLARDVRDAPEVLYALGEARWHAQRYEEGAATLERAFLADPMWQMALHHVLELRLSRGEGTQLAPIATKLRVADPPAAVALDCKIAISRRDYAGAVALTQKAIAGVDAIADIYLCLSHAQTLVGDLDGAQATAKRAFELWPIDYRDWGGFASYAEHELYRGRYDAYLELLRNKPGWQKSLAVLLWTPGSKLDVIGPVGSGMRMPPLSSAAWILGEKSHGRDTVTIYKDYPELEVRAFGYAVWAEAKKDYRAAIDEYRKALVLPAKGDMRMLTAHHLARALRASGDPAGAVAACQEVLAPRLYLPYRAIVWPDCVAWSGDPAATKQLLAAWTGTFMHPALANVKRATP